MINFENFDEIIIFQFGKVGSCTLRDTFFSLISGKEAGVDGALGYDPGKNIKLDNLTIIHTHESCDVSEIIKDTKRRLIINVTRNILDRNISMFFQLMDNKYAKNYYLEDRSFDSMMAFYRNLNESNPTHYLTEWYERFNNVLGIDIFDKKFDFEKGYTITEYDDFTLLILRFEDISKWENILSNIFNIQIKLVSSNETSLKPYIETYKKFKKSYIYNEYELTALRTKYMTHFYTDDELNMIESKYLD